MVNYKKILGIGTLVYFSNFLINIMFVELFQINLFISLANYFQYISILLTLIIVWICTALYFKNESSDFKHGLQVGFGFILVSFLFDLIFAFIGLALNHQSFSILIEYYKDIWFWITVILVILVSGVTGDLIQKRQ